MNRTRLRKRRKTTKRRLVRRITAPAPEVKFHDTTFVITALPGGIILPSVCEVAQGVGSNERIGRKIVVSKVQLYFQSLLLLTQNPSQAWDQVRFVIYQDKQTNGAAAVPGQLYEAVDPFAFRNLRFTDRFRILYDQRISINLTAASGTQGTDTFGSHVEVGQFSKDVNIPVEFSNPAGLLTAIASNNVGFLVLSSQNQRTTVSGRFRIRYYDS